MMSKLSRTDMPRETRYYRFYDRTLALDSNDEAVHELFSAVYRNFAVSAAEAEINLRCAALHEKNGAARITLQDKHYHLRRPDLLLPFAHGLTLRRTLAEIRGHLLFHAAALTYQSKGLILAGESGYGKTTLCLALLRHGFKFLSDEMAALRLKDGLLEAYPRCLWVRQGTYDLFKQLRCALPPHETVLRQIDRRALHPAAELRALSAPPVWLVLMEQSENTAERRCRVSVEHFETALRTMPGLERAVFQDEEENRGLPQIYVQAKSLQNVYDACDALNIPVLNVEVDAPAAGFSTEAPVLRAVSKMEAATALLRTFAGGHKAALLRERFGGGAAGLLWPLADLLKNTACYRLRPGPLNETVELLNDLCIR